jgi:hypothetical protein
MQRFANSAAICKPEQMSPLRAAAQVEIFVYAGFCIIAFIIE